MQVCLEFCSNLSLYVLRVLLAVHADSKKHNHLSYSHPAHFAYFRTINSSENRGFLSIFEGPANRHYNGKFLKVLHVVTQWFNRRLSSLKFFSFVFWTVLSRKRTGIIWDWSSSNGQLYSPCHWSHPDTLQKLGTIFSWI